MQYSGLLLREIHGIIRVEASSRLSPTLSTMHFVGFICIWSTKMIKSHFVRKSCLKSLMDRSGKIGTNGQSTRYYFKSPYLVTNYYCYRSFICNDLDTTSQVNVYNFEVANV